MKLMKQNKEVGELEQWCGMSFYAGLLGKASLIGDVREDMHVKRIFQAEGVASVKPEPVGSLTCTRISKGTE